MNVLIVKSELLTEELKFLEEKKKKKKEGKSNPKHLKEKCALFIHPHVIPNRHTNTHTYFLMLTKAAII